jgi:hypothetical protein
MRTGLSVSKARSRCRLTSTLTVTCGAVGLDAIEVGVLALSAVRGGGLKVDHLQLNGTLRVAAEVGLCPHPPGARPWTRPPATRALEHGPRTTHVTNQAPRAPAESSPLTKGSC